MQRSIRARLTILLAVLMISTILLLGLLQSYKLQEFFLEITRNRLFAQARQLTTLLNQEPGIVKDWESLIADISKSGEARVSIIREDGLVLADSERPSATLENHAARPEIVTALQVGHGWSVRPSDTLQQPMLYVAVAGLALHQESRAIVRLALPLSLVYEATYRLWQIIVTAIALTILAAVVVAVLVSRSITHPLEAMTEAARKMARGDLSQRVHVHRRDELGTLAESFNRLASSNEERFDELVTAKVQLETVLQNTVSGILLLDTKGNILLSNPTSESMLGFSEDELPANHWQLTHNYEMSQALDEAMSQAMPFKRDIRIMTPIDLVVELNVVPLPSVGRFVAVFYDVSESRRLAAVRADLVANVSHELKTPVTSIHGFAETLLQGALDDENSRRRFVEIIYRESGRLLRLVNDLLDLSRLELDVKAVEKKPTDLAKIVQDVVERWSLKAEAKQIQLRAMIGVREAPVEGDDYRLGQAIGNLLENAIKYTPARGEVRVNLQYEKGAYWVTVRDTGTGIEPEHLQRVFERFYRTDKARSRQHGGTGLGLAIVKHIVELHGGQVWAESKVGEGSTFHLRIPAAGE